MTISRHPGAGTPLGAHRTIEDGGYAFAMRRTTVPLIAATAAAAAIAAGTAGAWTGAGLVGGTWHGTLQSKADPSFTFPVHTTITIGADGTPHGITHLQSPLACDGRWTPTAQRGAVTTFSEAIFDNHGTRCLDDGTVQVSPASGNRLRYVWTKGDLASVGYLEGVSGTWRGEVVEKGGTPIAMTVTIRGTARGGVEGSVGYGRPLTCSGRWVPRDATSQPGWNTFTEVITRTASRVCMGVGRTAVRLRADGRLQYRWTDGPYATNGTLTRVAPTP